MRGLMDTALETKTLESPTTEQQRVLGLGNV